MKSWVLIFFSKRMAIATIQFVCMATGFSIVPSAARGQQELIGVGAQPDCSWSVMAGPVISSQRWLEKNFSSLSYGGTMAGAAIKASYHKRKAYLQINGSFASGNAQTRYEEVPGASLQQYGLSFQSGYSITNNDIKKFMLKAGGMLSVFYADRQYKGFINNSHSFESLFSIAPFIEACAKTGSETKPFFFSLSVAIPVLAAIAQPSYGNDALPVNSRGEQDHSLSSFLNANKIVSVNHYFQLNARLSVTKCFNNRHAVVFNYEPSYYQIRTDRNLRSFNQQFSLCYQYCL